MTTAVAQAPVPDTVEGRTVDVASVSVVPPDDPRWPAFLSASSGATPFHHPAWAKTISAAYGLRPFVVVLTAGEKVLAGLPAIETPSLLRTRRWVSLPLQTPVDRSPSRRPLRTLCSEDWIVSQMMRDGSWRSTRGTMPSRCKPPRCSSSTTADRRQPPDAPAPARKKRQRQQHRRVPNARSAPGPVYEQATPTSRRSTTSIWRPAAGMECLYSRGRSSHRSATG